MKVYRYADNPYKTSKLNTSANNLKVNGRGIFAFDPTRKAVRCFFEEGIEKEEEVTPEFLFEQFGQNAFGGKFNIIDIDEAEIYSVGYGKYANLQSNDWNDYIYPRSLRCVWRKLKFAKHA